MALPRLLSDWAAGGMSEKVFVSDHILLDVGLDAARCQLGRLAEDGVLLGAR
jgi:hypothetical protein